MSSVEYLSWVSGTQYQFRFLVLIFETETSSATLITQKCHTSVDGRSPWVNWSHGGGGEAGCALITRQSGVRYSPMHGRRPVAICRPLCSSECNSVYQMTVGREFLLAISDSQHNTLHRPRAPAAAATDSLIPTSSSPCHVCIYSTLCFKKNVTLFTFGKTWLNIIQFQ